MVANHYNCVHSVDTVPIKLYLIKIRFFKNPFMWLFRKPDIVSTVECVGSAAQSPRLSGT